VNRDADNPEPPPRTPTLKVLVAPWVAIVRPRLAGQWMAQAGAGSFIIALLFGLAACSAVVSRAMAVLDRRPSLVPASQAAIPPLLRPWVFSPVRLLGLTIALGSTALVLLAWLALPFVHRGGGAWRSFGRAYRAAGALLGPVLAAALLVMVVNAVGAARNGLGPDPPGMILLGWGGALVIVVSYFNRVAFGGLPPTPAPPPPRCEGCGYNLAHQPADQRCPECGLPLADSLDRARSRPDSPWAQRRSSCGYVTSAWQLVWQPRRFYRTLGLRGPDSAAARFAAWTFVRVFEGAVLWLLVCALLESFRAPYSFASFVVGSPPRLAVFANILMGFIGIFLISTTLVWLGHRVLAAIAATIWLLRGGLHDFHWGAQVIMYESAFLWVYCAFWGTLISSFMIGDNWISRWLGLSMFGFFGVPVELGVLLGGTLVLAGVSLWRYQIAYNAIRWAN
jgi:hypothetical protein